MPINNELQRKEIPFLVPDLPTCEELTPYLKSIDQNRWYSNFGPLQNQFEKGLCRAFFPALNENEERVIACSSGTAAIELALLALNLPKKARILIPSFTFAATATAVIRAGYVPVFTDVDSDSWLLTPEIANSVLDYLTVDAVIAVASLGVPQDVKAWDQFSESKNIPVIIDAAPALGEQQLGEKVTVCFSLHATKGFGIGEGGLVVPSTQEMTKQVRLLTNFGFDEGIVQTAGSNYKLSEYHAAVGLAQLKRLESLSVKSTRVRASYEKHMGRLLNYFDMQALDLDRWEQEPDVVGFTTKRFFSAAALSLKNASSGSLDKLVASMQEQGIGVRRWYNPVLHKHPAFNAYETISACGKRFLEATESLNDSLIGLPFHNFLTEAEIDFVCDRLIHSVELYCPVKLKRNEQ